MTRPDHPLLTRILDQALSQVMDREATEVVAGIPPDIADRLEAALDVCQHVYPSGSLCGGNASGHAYQAKGWEGWHEYVPLVEVPHD